MSGTIRFRWACRSTAALACLTWTCPHGVAQSPDPRLDELLSTAAVIVRTAPALAQVWDGFWPPDRPFILADSAHLALLYTTGPPPAGFEPVQIGTDVPGPPGITYLHPGRVAGSSASLGLMDLHFAIPGGEAVAVQVQGGVAGTLRFLYHESFHAYQDSAFTNPMARDIEVAVAEVTDSAFTALWDVERAILREALAADDAGEMRDLLRTYLGVRTLRAQGVRAPVAAYEDALERIEGSAEWVGWMSVLMATDGNVDRLRSQLRTDLRRSRRTPRYAPGGHWVIRMRVYATGAALCALLETLEPDWRNQVAAGQTLVAVATEAVGVRALDDAGIAAVRARFGS